MLFRDFFPRLRHHAFERYGQIITERQFRDWREDGLLPGPAAPKGQGRGKSPERHWSAISYRRALRICRYKSWGANRQSQWWLGFWLSGEAVAPSRIRSALKRECSIERRRNHSFITSDRWRETTFQTVADAERGGISGEAKIAGLLAPTKMTPDQYRRLSILQLDETSDADAENLLHEIAPSHFDLGPEFDDAEKAKAFAEIRADITPDEIKRIWRSGHMDREGVQSGKYIDDMPDSDFAICLEILRLREKIAIWNYALSWLMGNRSPEKILIYLLPILFSQAPSLQFRILQIIRIAFEIDADRREGHHSTWRLDGIAKEELKLKAILQRDNSEFR